MSNRSKTYISIVVQKSAFAAVTRKMLTAWLGSGIGDAV